MKTVSRKRHDFAAVERAILESSAVPRDTLGLEELELAGRATSEDDGGALVVAELFNLISSLWNASYRPHADADEVLLLARTVSDAGLRLRREAVELGLIDLSENDDEYAEPGRAMYTANAAVFACKEVRRAAGAIA